MRVVQDLGHVVDRADRDLDCVQRSDQFVARPSEDGLRQLRHDGCAVHHALRIVRKLRLPTPVFQRERLAERRPMLVAGGDVQVLAVTATKRRRGHTARMLGTKARRHFAKGEVPGGSERQQAHLPVQHGEIHVAALAGFLAARDRRQDGDRHPQPRSQVGHRQARLHRPAAALAGQAEQPAHRLEHRVVAFLAPIGAGLAEACAGEIDQPRIERGEGVVVEPVAFERA